jgi:transcriptional regulator with XRE-family HTH domain
MTIITYDQILKEELKKKLKEKGITQKMLAELMGLTQGNISRALSPYTQTTFALFCTMAQAADIQIKIE